MRISLRVVGVGLLGAGAAAWAATGDQTRDVPRHLALWALAWSGYAAALLGAQGISARGLRAMLGAALLCRLALIGSTPLLSDDVYRYVWEGRVQLHGGNPYAWADRPAAEKWSALRDDVWRGVNWKEYGAIYPPLWQLAARALVRVHDSVATMKLFLVLCEVASWRLLALALRRRGLPRERLLIAALSPLALVEIAGSGHNEALGLLLLAATLLALDSGRTLSAGLLVALACQAKLVPALIAAAWARRFRPRDVFAAALVAAALVLPYAGAGPDLLRSLQAYGREWRFNETGFALLALAPGGRAWPGRLALVLLGLLAARLAWRRVEALQAGLTVLVAWLVLMPSVLPWYALWLLPFLVLTTAAAPRSHGRHTHADGESKPAASEPQASQPQRGMLLGPDTSPLAVAAFVFTGTVGLAYLVYPGFLAGGVWQVGWGVRALEYGPCLLAAWWAARRAHGPRVA